MKLKLITIILTATALSLALSGLISAQETDDRPFLGVNIAESEAGTLVTSVFPGSAADEAGVLIGDIIIAVNGDVVNAETIVAAVGNHAIGDVVSLEIDRDGDSITLDATLTSRNDIGSQNRNNRIEIIPGRTGAFLGVQLESTDAGVRIVDVVADSPAESAGFESGDMITAINDETVDTVESAIGAFRSLRGGDEIEIAVVRDGETIDIAVTLADAPLRIEGGFNLRGDGLEYNEEEGLWEVGEINENSPLATAGIQNGDRIVAINGEPFESDEQNLFGMLENFNFSEDVTLTVERDGETLDVDVPGVAALSLAPLLPFRFGQGGAFELQFREGEGGRLEFEFGDRDGRGRDGARRNRGLLGVTFRTIDAQVAEAEGLDVTEGALIIEVAGGSPAEAAGVQADDIITSVSDDFLDFERTLADRIRAYEPGDTIMLTILRDGETFDLEVTLGQPLEQSARPASGFNG